MKEQTEQQEEPAEPLSVLESRLALLWQLYNKRRIQIGIEINDQGNWHIVTSCLMNEVIDIEDEQITPTG